MEKTKSINIGKIGQFVFEPAYYAYVGSAMTGIHRLKRHLRNLRKKDIQNKHWHIDFLIPHCKLTGYFFVECSEKNKEENLAISLSKKFDYINGFGASDTRAPSHLFKNKNLKKLKKEIVKSLKFIGSEDFRTNI